MEQLPGSKNLMRILWITGGPSETKMNAAINRILGKRGWKFTFISPIQRSARYLRSIDIEEAYFTDELMEQYGITEGSATDEQLRDMDRKYPVPGMHAIVKGDPFLRLVPYSVAMQRVYRLFTFWESYLDAHPVDWVLQTPSGTATLRIARITAIHRAIRTGILSTGPCRGRFSLLDVSEDWVWSGLLSALSNGRPEVDDAIQIRVQEFINDYFDMKSIQQPRRIASLKDVFVWQLRYLRASRGVVKDDEFYGIKTEKTEAARQLLWRLNKLNRRRIAYVTAPPSQPFVYFPWHAGYDANITARYPLYENQAELTRQIALSLPVGYTLYAKEHPYAIGYTDFSELRRLARLDNVKLIDPRVNSLEFLRKSAVVLTIGGTSGWEAFLLKRPVVTFGRSFYSSTDLVYSVEGITDLPSVLRRALDNGPEIYSERGQDWLAFIDAAISTSCSGNYFGYKPTAGGAWPADWSDENISEVADSLAQALENASESPLTLDQSMHNWDQSSFAFAGQGPRS